MPCRDYGYEEVQARQASRNNDKLHKRLDRFAAMLCASCKTMSDEQIKQVPGLWAWWKQHQIDDAVAYEKKMKKERKAKRRKELCASLSDEDKKILGIDCSDD